MSTVIIIAKTLKDNKRFQETQKGMTILSICATENKDWIMWHANGQNHEENLRDPVLLHSMAHTLGSPLSHWKNRWNGI